MPPLPQPAAALRDRAERHVFALLPELSGVQRRALALLELAGADREVAARDTGLDPEALGIAAAGARRALRRTRAPLAGGGRCERAEILVSDRLDQPLDGDRPQARHERKWLEIHLARCPRCIEHERLLGEARTELRAGFVVEPPKLLPPVPEPRALEAGVHLRVVPPPDGEATGPVATAPAAPSKPARRTPPAVTQAAKILAILVVIAAILAGLGLGIDALSGR
jgi:hypothetical protein